jgi:hypothetical protein
MCTATWMRRPGRYSLFFNRDELLTRAEAAPPRRRDDGSARWLAPEDGDSGGTWLAVNEAGVTVALLNGLPRELAAGVRSRGLLVRDLASAQDPDEVERRVRAADLDRVRPFGLLVLAPAPPARVLEWDGEELVVDAEAERRVPLISSSFDETEVGRRRRDEFDRVVGDDPTALRLLDYHHSHTNGPSAYSVCMHREEACTRSFARVDVSAELVTMTYHAGSPCEEGREVTVELERAPVGARKRGSAG